MYMSLIGFLNVAELGVGVAVGYSLYEPLSKNKYEKINDIMILFKYYYRNIAKIILIL
ncbi:sugar transporter, partial [Clostridium perfringens]|nr:sugar transporter [Clostridium perfringens]